MEPTSTSTPTPAPDFVSQLTTALPALRAFGRSLCGDSARADDLVQETMLKAWSARDRFQDGSNFKAWLFTILRNCYYSELRHRKFEIEDPEGELAARISVAPEHEIKLEVRDVSRALQLLPDDQREALILVCSTGLSYEEAATICACAVGTIKSRIARGRDKLMEILGGTRATAGVRAAFKDEAAERPPEEPFTPTVSLRRARIS